MKYFQLIKKYPFPENGKELNKELFIKLSDPMTSEADKEIYVTKLFQNNLGLVSKIYSTNPFYVSNSTIEEFLGFYYEALLISIKKFEIGKGLAFHNYLYSRMRKIIQKYYEFDGSPSQIHIPVNKKLVFTYENLQDISSTDINKTQTDELDQKFNLILDDPYFIRKVKECLEVSEYNFFKLCRELPIVEVTHKLNLTPGKFQRMFERVKNKLIPVINSMNLDEI